MGPDNCVNDYFAFVARHKKRFQAITHRSLLRDSGTSAANLLGRRFTSLRQFSAVAQHFSAGADVYLLEAIPGCAEKGKAEPSSEPGGPLLGMATSEKAKQPFG